MDLAHWLWIATAIYGVRALEEFIWRRRRCSDAGNDRRLVRNRDALMATPFILPNIKSRPCFLQS